MLKDDLSKLLFDSTLVLRLTGAQRYYYPRTDFEDLIQIVGEEPFQSAELPTHYLGLPLKVFDVVLCSRPEVDRIRIVDTKAQLSLLNSYRQYLVTRGTADVSPGPGDIVLDCGACIGEVSTLFAALVGKEGQVHAFDPVPLHSRYCRLQAELNPALAPSLHVNILAVGNRTRVVKGSKSDTDKITPGGLGVDSFNTTTLDDYAKGSLKRVDYIKMDIEGAELEAIEGASNLIREFKPRLAISAYHKANDLWEIPEKLKSLNPDYELFFGHHSPIQWESVFYAV